MKYTLLTNLRFITLNGVRTFCHALLITQDDNPVISFGGSNYSIRGFGTEAAWPVFDMALAKEDLPYSLTTAASDNVLVIAHDGSTKLLRTGTIMTFKSGLSLVLESDAASKPIDVTYEEDDISEVWRMLWVKTASAKCGACFG